jgi:hypothetical protein
MSVGFRPPPPTNSFLFFFFLARVLMTMMMVMTTTMIVMPPIAISIASAIPISAATVLLAVMMPHRVRATLIEVVIVE